LLFKATNFNIYLDTHIVAKYIFRQQHNICLNLSYFRIKGVVVNNSTKAGSKGKCLLKVNAL